MINLCKQNTEWRMLCLLKLLHKALANEDTLLPTHLFPRLPARATFVADTNFVSGTQKRFLIFFRNILCPQQMFPSLRSPRNIMSNNVSGTMCPVQRRKWSPTANDRQTGNDPQIGLQMIPNRKWSPMRTASDPARKWRIAWSLVSWVFLLV